MQEIKNKNLKLEKESYKLLNMRVYEKLNEHLLNKVKIINRLKSETVEKFDNVEYELYLTPDTTKVRLFTKMMEIKKTVQNFEAKIGAWDIVLLLIIIKYILIHLNTFQKSKKQSIGEVVNSIKNNLRLFDKEYQKEIQTKMDALNTRLKELNEGKEEFYQTISKTKIDELFKGFSSSKQVEDLIFKTVTKMESLQNNHEESAYIFLKLKEMLEQHEKISITIEENQEVLSNLKVNITDNVKTMKKNTVNIRERLNKLKII